MTGNLRMQMGILASALAGEGKKQKAKDILDKCMEKMPDENIPFDATMLAVCGGYYEIGENAKANEIAKKLFDIFEGDLKIYLAQTNKRKYAYGRDINMCKDMLERLTRVAQQYKQDALYKDFLSRMMLYMTQEDLNPQQKAEPAQPLQP